MRAVWFYWPITFAMAGTLGAVHLFKLNGHRGFPVRLAASGMALLSMSLAVVPLMLGVYPECHDELHDVNVNVAAAVVGAFGIVAWLALLWRQYMAAGLSAFDAQFPPVLLCGLIAVGILVEFFFSAVSLAVYCTDEPGALWAHASAAVTISALAGLGLAMRLRRS